ncbi:MAG: hypothetical protein QM538_03790 [Methylacidiphilales bacterium]|nr:hypothetical protein [Candidatus Methylacidiphilales bacterium]
MNETQLTSPNSGTHVCLIQEFGSIILKGELQGDLKSGAPIKVGNHSTSRLKHYVKNESGIFLTTENSIYRLTFKGNPLDAILSSGNQISIVKVTVSDNAFYSEASTGDVISGKLLDDICYGQPILLLQENSRLFKSSTVIRVFKINHKLKLIQTKSSLYKFNLS